MMTMLNNLWNDESGQGMVEYGLILALVAVGVIGLLAAMGGQIKEFFQRVIDGFEGAEADPGL